MKKLIYSLLFLSITSLLWSDDIEPPYSYVTTSGNGRFYYKMKSNETGTLYKVTNENSDPSLWHTSGWYAYRVFLSNDGKYLVRLGSWPLGHEPTKEHVAIAFYENGNLLKSYSTEDLIEDKSQAKPSVSHYQFMKNGTYLQIQFDSTFSLITIDNIEYIFSIKTGEIVKKTHK